MKMQLRVSRDLTFRNHLRGYLASADGRGVVTGLTAQKVGAGDAIPDSALIDFSEGAAQQLMDDLYIAGVRPTEGAGSAGAMAAAKENLKDLRGVVANLFELVKR